VRLSRVAAALLILAVLAACSDDEPTSSSSDGSGATAPTTMARLGTTLPAEAGIVEDLVVVRRDGLHSVDGTVLVAFDEQERACIEAAVDDVPELLQTQPAGGDTGLEETLAEIVVGCVDIERIGPVVVEELVPNLALEGVDRACIEQEVATLQDSPEELAAVLAGDPSGIAAIARVIAANCA
jgi:hypothetical protein